MSFIKRQLRRFAELFSSRLLFLLVVEWHFTTWQSAGVAWHEELLLTPESGDTFGVLLEGVRLPRASRNSLDFPEFPRTSPEVPGRLPQSFSHCGLIRRAIQRFPEISQTSLEVSPTTLQVSQTSPKVNPNSLGSPTPSNNKCGIRMPHY